MTRKFEDVEEFTHLGVFIENTDNKEKIQSRIMAANRSLYTLNRFVKQNKNVKECKTTLCSKLKHARETWILSKNGNMITTWGRETNEG